MVDDIKQKIKFVNFSQVFLDKSFEWLQDPEIKYLTDSPDITKEAQQNWFNSLSQRSDYKIWGIEFANKQIGVVGLKHIDTQQHTAEYFGYIGEKKYWGHGIGKMIVEFCIKEARDLKITKLYLNVIRDNVRAIKLYEHFNFDITNADHKTFIMTKKLY